MPNEIIAAMESLAKTIQVIAQQNRDGAIPYEVQSEVKSLVAEQIRLSNVAFPNKI